MKKRIDWDFVALGAIALVAGAAVIGAGFHARIAPLAAAGAPMLIVGFVVLWTGRPRPMGPFPLPYVPCEVGRGESFPPAPSLPSPPDFCGYRADAGATAPTVREAYGEQLAHLPLPKLRLRTEGDGRTALGVRRLLAFRKTVAVEIDDEPVFLGDETHISIAQRGPRVFRRLQVWLVCHERTARRVGRNTSREEHEVSRQQLLDEKAIRIPRGERWTRRIPVRLPAGPPSFFSRSNEVAWAIVVKADSESGSVCEESFVFRAVPRVVS